MKNLFNLENPFFQFLNRVADMIVINLLFLMCCIPIVTAGASWAALQKLMQDMVYDNEGHLFRRFFLAFKDNFKQATPVGLAVLVIVVALVCDFLLISVYFEGTLATVLYTVLAVLAVLVFMVLGVLFPMLVRYQNTVREHLYNAIILSITKLPRSLLTAVLNLMPLILFIISPTVFIQTLVFWVFIGFSFVAFITASLFKPVFTELERANAGDGSVSIMK